MEVALEGKRRPGKRMGKRGKKRVSASLAGLSRGRKGKDSKGTPLESQEKCLGGGYNTGKGRFPWQ